MGRELSFSYFCNTFENRVQFRLKIMKLKKLYHIIIATGFGTGFSPFAPGTAGAILATFIWYLLSLYAPILCLYYATISLILLFTVLGVLSSNALESSWGKDPSRIVVDEMVGVWIALLGAIGGAWWTIVLAFIFFRLFDIFKPLGIRAMEKFKGGWGVMMDDILSGIYGLLLLILIRCVAG